MPRPLVTKALLPDWHCTEEGARTSARSFRRQYRPRDGYSVRRVHRTMTAHGHGFGFHIILVLGPESGGEDDDSDPGLFEA